MFTFKIQNSSIRNNIYIPKYYDPIVDADLKALGSTHRLLLLGKLIDDGVVSILSGNEVGKMAYGTGDIPFIRTSDISNWEIKTIPKQGISKNVYDLYARRQQIIPGDILLVKDGTYLIGTNCIVTELDTPLLFQSHILRIRVEDPSRLEPVLLFLILNSNIVQRQIRNIQFTADIIDTIGTRYRELILPIPFNAEFQDSLIQRANENINNRMKCKAVIKQFPLLMEQVLANGDVKPLDSFIGLPIKDIKKQMVQDTTTLEFGNTVNFTLSCSQIAKNIYLPKYYDPTIEEELKTLEKNCIMISIGELIKNKILAIETGDEIGKMAYGTGDIPFIRTTDFSNWELKSDPKQGVSQEIYELYNEKEDLQPLDILLVRDGTYLIGTSCIITENDTKMLYCGGLFKIRSLEFDELNPYLLLGLLNSYIVKRQIRTKQFTRDVIDTIGKRITEVILPIPKDKAVVDRLVQEIKDIINCRISARNAIVSLANEIEKIGAQ